MSSQYEKATHRHSVHRKGHPEPLSLPLSEEIGPSARCQRPHCGGLMLRRVVVTVDGTCEEYVCSGCSRSELVRIVEPYAPLPIGDPKWAGKEPVSRSAAQDSDDSEGTSLPPDVLEAAELDKGFQI